MNRWTKIAMCLLVTAFCAMTVYITAAQDDGGAKYLGEKTCRKCHIKEYKTWKDTNHAKAFSYLTDDQKKDPECIQCHTTGHGSGGFVSMDATPELENVQCEQCHGSGSEHVPMMEKLKKDKVDKSEYPEDKHINPTPTGCTKCHNPHKKHAPVEKAK
jgi:hypothetical protein